MLFFFVGRPIRLSMIFLLCFWKPIVPMALLDHHHVQVLLFECSTHFVLMRWQNLYLMSWRILPIPRNNTFFVCLYIESFRKKVVQFWSDQMNRRDSNYNNNNNNHVERQTSVAIRISVDWTEIVANLRKCIVTHFPI